MEKMRINKFIASSGYCSRRRADALLSEGKVLLNGKRAEVGSSVSDKDKVTIDGKRLTVQERDTFLAFHKPVGAISTADENADNTVFDYLPDEGRLFYVGRLDVMSSGLMIFTNNGDVANKVSHARGDCEKEYVVTLDRAVTRRLLTGLRDGVYLDGSITKPARAKKLGPKKIQLIITEGRNRQVRRMCEKFGFEVKKLRRTAIGNVRLGQLGEGNWRALTKTERRGLFGI
jgi:23S rRNA pseudouridine2604 synthase